MPSSHSDTWEKRESTSYPGKCYFYSSSHQRAQWERPCDLPSVLGKKRGIDHDSSSTGNEISSSDKVAIIVPFRDLDVEQQRQQHLDILIPTMTKFLKSCGVPFCIYIIEQSADNRKFNRGKLLNVGFDYAVKENCKIFIFHDVDLIPSTKLKTWYSTLPAQPCHIARVWNRYSGNQQYFGGVVSFSAKQYRDINGFPNTFWGWGGEDDEMYKRVRTCGYEPISPAADDGAGFLDLEENDLQQKILFLRQRAQLKCMNKNEVLHEHEATWQANGLHDLRYTELRSIRVGSFDAGSVKITVEIGLNDHWTDLVCSDDDKQTAVAPEQAKEMWEQHKLNSI